LNKLCIRNIFIVIALASIGGCVINPATEETGPVLSVEEREAKLKAFTSWRAQGSISVDSKAEGKFHASFAWDVEPQALDIKLFGPLGVQVFHIVEDSSGATLTDRSGQVTGDSAESLLQAALGVAVPLENMKSWAVGLPAGASETERDDAGRLHSIKIAEDEQMQWNVDYKRYTLLDGLDLPKTVLIEGDDVSIKLAFKKWSRAQPASNDRLLIPGVAS